MENQEARGTSKKENPGMKFLGKTKSFVIGRILLYAGVGLIFYIIGFSLGLVPKPVTDGIKWTADNFTLLAFLFCFTVGAIVVLKVLGKKRGTGK